MSGDRDSESNASQRGVESSITDPPRERKRARRSGEEVAIESLIKPATEWCFTYNNYSSECVDRLLRFFATVGARYVFQRERGDSGTPHLQGVVRFTKPVVPSSLFSKVEPLWRSIHFERTRSWEHSIRYCSKAESREEGTEPYSNVEILDVPTIYGWQSYLVDTLMPRMKHRFVYWFWEKTGGVGKSMLVRYLCMTRPALLVSGKDADIKHGVVAFKEATGDGPEVIIVDCPRSSVGYVSYSGIEQVANGCFFSSKYESAMCVTRYPLIICFANEPPNILRMSLDRWQIYRIDASQQILILEDPLSYRLENSGHSY